MASTAILSVNVRELHITVRPYRLDDLEDVLTYGNNANIAKALQRLPHPYTRKDAEWWINHCMDVKLFLPSEHLPTTPTDADANINIDTRLPSDYVIALEDKLIGSIGLTSDPINPQAVIFGYWLAEPFWHKGIVSAVAKSFVQWTFDTFPWIVRVEADAYGWNLASQAILKKAGLECEGSRKMKICKNGDWCDLVLFGKVRNGWSPQTK